MSIVIRVGKTLYAVLLHFGSQLKFSNDYQWYWGEVWHRYGNLSGLPCKGLCACTRSVRIDKDAPNNVIIKVVYVLALMIVIYY